MSFNSVSGRHWLFKKFNSSDVSKFAEDYSLTETVAKLLSIRKNTIDDVNLFLNPKIKNLLPNPLHLKDMNNAIQRTYKSIIKKETWAFLVIMMSMELQQQPFFLVIFYLSNKKYKLIFQIDRKRDTDQIKKLLKPL